MPIWFTVSLSSISSELRADVALTIKIQTPCPSCRKCSHNY